MKRFRRWAHSWMKTLEGSMIVAGLREWNIGDVTESITGPDDVPLPPGDVLPNGMRRTETAVFDHRDQIKRNIGFH